MGQFPIGERVNFRLVCLDIFPIWDDGGDFGLVTAYNKAKEGFIVFDTEADEDHDEKPVFSYQQVLVDSLEMYFDMASEAEMMEAAALLDFKHWDELWQFLNHSNESIGEFKSRIS